MPTTKYLLAERAQLYLDGGRIGDATKIHINELKLAVESILNKLLKTEYYSTNAQTSELIANNYALCTYDNLPVVKYKNVSKTVLPAMPVRLPMNMGVDSIFSSDDVTSTFIPAQRGDIALIASLGLINNLMDEYDLIFFEVSGLDIIYDQDLTENGTQTPTVTIKLVLFDFSQYSDTDILPLDPSMEWDVFCEVIKIYGAEPPQSVIDDPGQKEMSSSKQTMG